MPSTKSAPSTPERDAFTNYPGGMTKCMAEKFIFGEVQQHITEKLAENAAKEVAKKTANTLIRTAAHAAPKMLKPIGILYDIYNLPADLYECACYTVPGLNK